MKQGYRLMGILGVLLIYELFVQCVHQPIILPSLISVFEAAYEIVSDPMFTVTVLSTVRRTVLTFTGVLIISLLLGIYNAFKNVTYYFNHHYFINLVWGGTGACYDYGLCDFPPFI